MDKRQLNASVRPHEVKLEGDFWQVAFGASWIWVIVHVLVRLLTRPGKRRR